MRPAGERLDGLPPGIARRVRTLAILTGHFVRRFTSFETVAPGTNVREVLVPVLGLLAIPGYGLSYATAFTRAATMRYDPVPLFSARWLLLTWSFVVVGLLATLQWEAFFIDRRDHLNLGILPVRRADVFVAKLAGLLISVLSFHVAVNAVSGLLFPSSFPRYLHTALVHQGVLLLQSLFVAFTVASIQGGLALLPPWRMVNTLTRAAQPALLVVFASLLALQQDLGQWMRTARVSDRSLIVFFPPAWFMGLYDRLLGVSTSAEGLPASLALLGPPAAFSVCAALCFLSLHAGIGGGEERSALSPRNALSLGLDRAFQTGCLRSPRERAIFGFARRALSGVSRSRLILVAWLAAGVALSLWFLAPLLGGTTSAPCSALLAPTFILVLFGLVGLRLGAAFPIALDANWVFGVAERPSVREHIRALRATTLRTVIAPLLGALTLPYLALWGLRTALAHLVFSLLVAMLTAEVLFLGFAKIPFTCNYVPGRAQLWARWPLYGAVAMFFCGILPAAEVMLLRSPTRLALAVAGLGGAVLGVARWRQGSGERPSRLVFEERRPPLITRLEL